MVTVTEVTEFHKDMYPHMENDFFSYIHRFFTCDHALVTCRV